MKQLIFEEALEQADRFPYAYLTEYSRVYVGKNTGKTDLSQLLEARFFGEDGELRLCKSEKGWEALLYEEENEDHFRDDCCRLLPAFGKTLTVRRVFGWDEDGQAYIRYTRLLAWEGGGCSE